MTAFAVAIQTVAADPNIGAAATWISKAGGPSVSLRVIPSRPEEPFGEIGNRGVASPTSCKVALGALPGKPIKGDLIAFNDQGYIVENVEQDARSTSYVLGLRRV